MSYHSELDAQLRALAAACQTDEPTLDDMPAQADPMRPLLDELQAQFTAASMERIRIQRRPFGRRLTDRLGAVAWRALLSLAILLALALYAMQPATVEHFEDGAGRLSLGQYITVTYCLPGQLCDDSR